MKVSTEFLGITTLVFLLFIAFMGEMNNHRDDCKYKQCLSIDLNYAPVIPK